MTQHKVIPALIAATHSLHDAVYLPGEAHQRSNDGKTP
jgi:hypothetical protein